MLGRLWRKWRQRRWWVRWIVYAAVPVVLFYGVEDLRGWRAWQSYRKAAEARGDRLEIEAWISEPIPDEQNFAATPFIRDLYQREGDFDPPTEIHQDLWEAYDPFPWVYRELCRDYPLETCYEEGRFSRAEAARQIEIDLKPWEPIIAELAEAVRRPHCDYPVDLAEERWMAQIHHFSAWITTTRALNLRSIARIHAGDAEGALSDLEVLFGFSRHAAAEGAMIPVTIRMGITYQSFQPVWEGLKSKRWNDSQLERLSQVFSSIDLSRELMRSFLIERAVFLAELEALRTDLLYRHERFDDYPDLQFLFASGNGRIEAVDAILSRTLLTIAPRGWYWQNMRNVSQGWDSLVNSRPWDQKFQPLDSPALAASALPARPTPYTVFLENSGPSAGMNLKKQADVTQTMIELVEVAIALERYRLVKNTYPKALDDLTPAYLASVPEDPFTSPATKINYGSRPDGTIALWSVANGGNPKETAPGDVVWQYSLPPGFDVNDYER